MSSGTVCSNCGRVNRVGAKMCSSCGKPLAQTPSAAPPIAPPQKPASPRQPPTPPRQAQGPQTPPAPARQPPPQIPRQPPAASPRPAAPNARFPLRPWQIAAIVGFLFALCVCVLAANAVFGLFNPKSAPTATLTATRVPASPSPAATATSQPVTVPPTPTAATPTPTATSTATLPAATATQTNSPTPSLTPTNTPTPTASPTVTSTPTDTPKDTILLPGLAWQQQEMTLSLRTYNFAGFACPNPSPILEFSMMLTNNRPGQLVVNWHGENLTVADDSGKQYDVYYQYQQESASLDCTKYQPAKGNILVQSLSGNASASLALRVQGVLQDTATKLTVTVAQAGRIENARWEIPIPK